LLREASKRYSWRKIVIYDKSPHSSVIEPVVLYSCKTVTVRELRTGCLVSCP